jgi:hypothetical protein
VVLLGDRDERHVVSIKELDEFGKVRERTGQAIDFVNDNDLDFAGSHVLKQPLQGGSFGIAA